MTRINYLRSLVVVVIAAIVAVFLALDLGQYFTLAELRDRRDELLAFTEANLLLVIGLYMIVYIVMAGLSLPGAAILTIAGGALFGLVTGTVVVSFASTLGATLAFVVARFLLRDFVQSRFGKRLEAVNRGVEKDGAFYLLALRLVPAFPFFVINVVMALTPIRTWTFFWVSQLGMLPATAVYVNAGTQLAAVDSVGDIFSPGLLGAFALLALLPLLLKAILAWLERRRVYRGFRRPKSFDYNLVVIGGGAAGLVSAYIGSAIKARVALVEKNRMGGDCLNTGCVPSKTLLRAAGLVAEARNSKNYGIESMEARFSLAGIMDRVREVIKTIEPHDSPERYRSLGVDVVEGSAEIISPWEVEVDGRRLSARSIILATGAEPLVPPIDGLEEIDYLTSDNLWDLEELPEKLVVLGGGPIGSEMAQAFGRLGSKVTVVEMADRLLPREDPEAGQALAGRLQREGMEIALAHRAVRVESGADGNRLVCEHEGEEKTIAFDRILIALGRKARTEGFGLEKLGVELNRNGTIAADGLMRTRFPNVYVCGDAAGPFQFTHVAAHQAWFASVNALLAPFWSFRADYSVIPWATFTDPEIARVGISEDEAREQGVDYEVTRYDLTGLDRAITDGHNEGFVKVLTVPGKDRILGVTIVGAQAGNMIAEFVLAMKHGLGLNKLLGTIHVYPTMMEANKYVAGNWKKDHAPQAALRWVERFHRLRR